MPIATTVTLPVPNLQHGDLFEGHPFHHHDQVQRKADRDSKVVAVFTTGETATKRITFDRTDQVTIVRNVATYGERLAIEAHMFLHFALANIKTALEFDSSKELLKMITGRNGVVVEPRYLVRVGPEIGDILTRAQRAVLWGAVERDYSDTLAAAGGDEIDELGKAALMAIALNCVVDLARQEAEGGPRDDQGTTSHRFARRCEWDGTCAFLKDAIGWGGYSWTPLLAYEAAAVDVAAHGADRARVVV